MRKPWGLAVTLTLLVNLVVGGTSAGQVENLRWQDKTKIGFMGNGNLLIAPMSENHVGSNPTAGLGAFLDYQIKNNLYLNVTLDYNRINVDTEPELKSDIIRLSLGGKYYFLPKTKINPFIGAGLGPFSFTQTGYRAASDRYFDFITCGGLGAEISFYDILGNNSEFAKKLHIVPRFNYNISFSDDIDQSEGWDTFITASLGFSYDLSAPKIVSKKKHKEKIVKVEKPKKPKEVKAPEKKAEKIEKEELKSEKVQEKPEEKEEPVKEPKEKEQKVEKIQEKPEKEVQPEFYDELQYMIKPHDYLAKIARQLYGDKSKWKSIWKWNEELVGNDPNLIYPYYELQLKNVPVESTASLEYDYYKYEVGSNEDLRSIASKEYGSSYAWVIIYRDNKSIINLKERLTSGTVLKLRTKLFNQ